MLYAIRHSASEMTNAQGPMTNVEFSLGRFWDFGLGISLIHSAIRNSSLRSMIRHCAACHLTAQSSG
jgi:hypothetical protein